ncbi:DUF1194 domain-containing protein [Hoeflea sp.]|uniref:DUF1194 domain-containing protein n=1 Tax=Hoeflea sp. TaxID=1940281 RepID=UPI003A918A92
MTNKGAGRGFNIDYLDQYCAHCVIGGPGNFLVPDTDWLQFPETIRRKLTLEIGGTLSSDLAWFRWRLLQSGAQKFLLQPLIA